MAANSPAIYLEKGAPTLAQLPPVFQPGKTLGQFPSPGEDAFVINNALEILGPRLRKTYPVGTVTDTIDRARYENTTTGISDSQPVTTARLLRRFVPSEEARLDPYAERIPLEREFVQGLQAEIKEDRVPPDTRIFSLDETIVVHAALQELAKRKVAELALEKISLDQASASRPGYTATEAKKRESDLRRAKEAKKRESDLRTLAANLIVRKVVPGYAGELARDAELRAQRKAELSKP
jgi:hypothetical protein